MFRLQIRGLFFISVVVLFFDRVNIVWINGLTRNSIVLAGPAVEID
jgi:hypothetical protein